MRLFLIVVALAVILAYVQAAGNPEDSEIASQQAEHQRVRRQLASSGSSGTGRGKGQGLSAGRSDRSKGGRGIPISIAGGLGGGIGGGLGGGFGGGLGGGTLNQKADDVFRCLNEKQFIK